MKKTSNDRFIDECVPFHEINHSEEEYLLDYEDYVIENELQELKEFLIKD